MRLISEKKVITEKPEWQRWFAWRPVTIETQNNTNVLVWFEYVERKVTIGYMSYEYRYRDIL